MSIQMESDFPMEDYFVVVSSIPSLLFAECKDLRILNLQGYAPSWFEYQTLKNSEYAMNIHTSFLRISRLSLYFSASFFRHEGTLPHWGHVSS